MIRKPIAYFGTHNKLLNKILRGFYTTTIAKDNT